MKKHPNETESQMAKIESNLIKVAAVTCLGITVAKLLAAEIAAFVTFVGELEIVKHLLAFY